MSNLYIEKLTRHHGDGDTTDYWVLYQHGHFATPVAIMDEGDAEKLCVDVIEKLMKEIFTLVFGTWFCYVNEPVIGIMRRLRRGKRVAYIDIDAHHGDGVQKAFYNTNQVLTISLHETGYTLFPRTGFEYEIGEGEGKGYSVNLPFPSGTEDDVDVWTFEEVVPELIHAFQPDVVVTQLGVDTFYESTL